MKAIRNKRGRVLASILLTVLLLTSLMPATALADNASGTVIEENHTELWSLPQGDTLNNNYSILITNDGAVVNNHSGSIINTSSGTVANNAGVVSANNGAVTNNLSGGVIGVNAAGGTVANNAGTVGVNRGAVTNNLSGGVIGANNTGGTIANNAGTVFDNVGAVTNNLSGGEIKDNNAGGTVANNAGTVFDNEGAVTNNLSGGEIKGNNAGGTVANNAGTVANNEGTVETNYTGATVGENRGSVELNAGTVEANFEGGTVVNLYAGSVQTNYGGTVLRQNANGELVPDAAVNQFYLIDLRDVLNGILTGQAGDVQNADTQAADKTYAKAGDGKIYTANIDARVGYTVQVENAGDTQVSGRKDGSGWTFTITNLVNNLHFIYCELLAPAPLSQEEMDAQFKLFCRLCAQKILAADAGAAVEIDAGCWPGVGTAIAEAMAERSDVSVVFTSYAVEGGVLTVPAGTDLLSLLDEVGFLGFADLAAALA